MSWSTSRRAFLLSAGVGALRVSIGDQPALPSDRWEPDGAGTVARFGVLTPDFDPVPESELCVMAPPGVSIHAARVPRGGPSPRAFAEPPLVDQAVDRLVGVAPKAILFAYTSSSYVLRAEAERQVQDRLEQRAKGVSIISTCLAAAAALRLLGARRLSLVHPPWFSEDSNSAGAAYWREAGFDVVQCVRLEPSRSFTEVNPAEVFQFVSANTPREVDAVLIGGNGLRAIGTIRALEERLRKPVLSANQVLMWAALRRVGKTASVWNYGSVFRTRDTAG